MHQLGIESSYQALEETEVNINTNITYDTGYSYDDLKSYIEQAVEEYLLELRKKMGRE